MLIWIKLASVLMAVGIILGAFGGHALKAKLDPYHLEVYKIAVLYHLIHALGLFAVAWVSSLTNDPKVTLAGYFLLAGIVLFSGSLYILSITQIKWIGAITPLGGLSFIIGWILLALIKY